MSNSLIKTIALVCYSVLLFACARVQRTEHWTEVADPLDGVIRVDWCELIDHAESYESKFVQADVILVNSFEGAFAYDPRCVTDDRLAWYKVKNASVNEMLDPKYDSFDSPEFRSTGLTRVRATFTGKLFKKKDEGFGHMGSSNYLFEIYDATNVSSVPGVVPYPWKRSNEK